MCAMFEYQKFMRLIGLVLEFSCGFSLFWFVLNFEMCKSEIILKGKSNIVCSINVYNRKQNFIKYIVFF